jgi:hypothetical protein
MNLLGIFTMPSKDVLVKVLKGACIAGGGALLTYLAEAVKTMDFGLTTPVVVAAFSVAINYIRLQIKK